MSFLLMVDKFMETACMLRSFRVLIVGVMAVLLLSTGWFGGRTYYLALRVDALKGDVAIYADRIATQNAAIIKAGEDMAAMQKQTQEAKQKAAALKKQLEQRKVEIREVVLTGPCPDMVQQVIEEVRK